MTDLYSGLSAALAELDNGVEWAIRPYREGDIPAIVALINAADAVDKLDQSISEDELRLRYASPRSDPPGQVILVEGPKPEGMPDNALIGYGRITYMDDEDANVRIYSSPRVVVHPAARERGLELALAQRLIEMARANEQRPDLPRMSKALVKAYIQDRDTTRRQLWEELGLREVRQFWMMARSLNETVDEPQPVDGILIYSYRRPEDNERTRVAFNLSFSDHFDFHPETEEDWNYWIDTPGVRPDLSWLAEVEDEPGTIAGFCICSVYDAENKRTGRLEGWIGELGTIPGWRRKGLGRALLLYGLHSLRSAGLDTALLGVDSESLTGAQRLYESVGFRIREREWQLECPLDEVKV